MNLVLSSLVKFLYLLFLSRSAFLIEMVGYTGPLQNQNEFHSWPTPGG